jgi:hypothetical protein
MRAPPQGALAREEGDVNEERWLASADPTPMLEFLRGRASDRKMRLFVCEMMRLDHTARTPDARNSIELGERWADGRATDEELQAFRRATPDEDGLGDWLTLAPEAIEAAAIIVESNRSSLLRQVPSLLRDIFGNPFRPSPPIPPTVLAWNGGTVKRLAEDAYETRVLPSGHLDTQRLRVLADALLDAGCDDEPLIRHLRSDGPHVRGCWAIDLILGKE